MDGNGRWASRRGLPAHRRAHRGRGEPGPRSCGVAVTARHRLAHRVRVLDRELGPAARRGPPHPRACTSKLFGRVDELNELNVRIQWIGRPFDSPRRAHPEVRPAGDPQGDRRHRRQHRHGAHRRVRLRRPRRADRRRRGGPRRGHGRSRRTRSPTHLYLPELPPVDVLVRTSGERRVSNFLLWQSAGARRSTSPTSTWPDFDAAELDAALALVRDRRVTPTPATSTARALDAVTAALPAPRTVPASGEMAELVAAAIDDGRHLVVQAGTGTGKTLAYLVPAIAVGAARRRRDRHQGAAGPARRQGPAVPRRAPAAPFDWAVLKGRSNYLCLQRLREVQRRRPTASSSSRAWRPTTQAEIKRLAEWAGDTDTGDHAELDWAPSDAAWRAVSVGSDECPGADRCPLGEPCFAEQARRRAAAADVVVVNTHLYGLARRQRRGDPARARRRGVRRGPRARGHHERHRRRADRARRASSRSAGTRAPDPRRPDARRRGRRARRRAARGASGRTPASACRRRYPTRSTRSSSRPATASTGSRAALRAIDTQIEDAKQRKLRAQTMTGRADRAPRHRARATTTGTSTSCPARPSTRASRSRRSTSARRCATGVWGERTRDPHQRDDPGVARRPRRPAAGRHRRRRRRQPVRLRAPTRSCTARMHLPDPRSDEATATRCTTSWPR